LSYLSNACIPEWDGEAAWLFKPYLEGTLPIGTLVAPHNEHHFLWTRLFELLLLELNGRWDPVIEMIFVALVHVAALTALVVILGATLDGTQRLVLAITTAILFALPFGSSNTLFSFQSFYLLPLFSLACIYCGVDARAFSGRWWGAMALGVGAYYTIASGALTLLALIAIHGLQIIVRQRSSPREWAAMALGIVIVVLMLISTPTITGHAPLAAHSVAEFVSAFLVAMAWPLSEIARLQPRTGWDVVKNLTAAMLVNIPILAFAWSHAKHLDTADRSVWIYLLIALWSTAQAASLAYGRAPSILDSRYLDILIINTILNVACLLRLLQVKPDYAKISAAWGFAIAVMVAVLAIVWLPRELQEWRTYTQQHTINLSAYLATGDKSHLADKPFRTIPYGSAERLATLADDPTIRSILPEDIMPAAELGTPNSRLLLGGPLHGAFRVLRRSLTFLGLFCLTAGALIFVLAGYVFYPGQVRWASTSVTDVQHH
jgi:hypothetical protein